MEDTNEILEYIIQNLHPNEESLGKLVAKLYEKEYLVVKNTIFLADYDLDKKWITPSYNVWYKYDTTCWYGISTTSDKYKFEIRNKLCDEVLPLIKKAVALYKKKTYKNTEESTTSTIKNDKKITDLIKAQQMLCDTNHRNNILTEAEARLFVDEEFMLDRYDKKIRKSVNIKK